MDNLTTKDLLFLLVLKVGVAGSLAALLARSSAFRKVLYTEERDWDLKARLLLFMTPPLALATMLRLVDPSRFADLTLEGSFLLGLLGGRVVGPLGGALVSLPGFFNREWLVVPVACLAGLLGGLIRQVLPNKESIWNFGPFTFLSIPRRLVIRFRDPNTLWDLLPLVAVVVLELGRLAMARMVPGRWLFALDAHSTIVLLLVPVATMMAVAVPLKIWNTTRIEMKLEQNQQLLLKARMDALTSQINPHFLFNTLNAVSSLIRFDPDTARGVVLKLSNILRRLLRKQENFVPLREELEFVDDYLDIEVARFGRDKLQIFKQIDEHSLEAFVPSMLLQPIVENSIKHGLSPRLEGGVIHIRTARLNGRVVIEVRDNGIGISEDRISQIYHTGIGISNVMERLRVLYGEDFVLQVNSKLGEGVSVRIEVPELITTSRS